MSKGRNTQDRLRARSPLLKKEGEVIESDGPVMIEVGRTGTREVAHTGLPQQAVEQKHVPLVHRGIAVQIRRRARWAEISDGHDVMRPRGNEEVVVDVCGIPDRVMPVERWRTRSSFATITPADKLSSCARGNRIIHSPLNRNDRWEVFRNLGLFSAVGTPGDHHSITANRK